MKISRESLARGNQSLVNVNVKPGGQAHEQESNQRSDPGILLGVLSPCLEAGRLINEGVGRSVPPPEDLAGCDIALLRDRQVHEQGAISAPAWESCWA